MGGWEAGLGTPRTGEHMGVCMLRQRLTESAFRRLEVALSSLGIMYYKVLTGLVGGRCHAAVDGKRLCRLGVA